ncbi:MAG: hypothetical protein GY715_19510, partial [Planctomycetes bacterium]|nr:hypothetical protein [Planctomycetota bacterium]
GQESGIAGVTVALLRGGVIVATTVTDVDGSFTFADLPAGEYRLAIRDLGLGLNGLLPTTPAASAGGLDVIIVGTTPVSQASFGYADSGALEGLVGTTIRTPDADVDVQTDTVVDDNVLDYDFGYRAPASIGDRVWQDLNGDGDDESGAEPGIENVTVRLLDGTGAPVLDEFGVPITDVTDSDGRYLFADLLPGDYQVAIDGATLPPGLVQTFEKDGTFDGVTPQTVAGGDEILDVDFGYVPAASIGDRVWQDTNGDGDDENGAEPGIANVTVRLLDGAGAPVLDEFGDPITDVTDSDGRYLFTGLLPGDYQVAIDGTTLPAGLVQTFEKDGSFDGNTPQSVAAGDEILDVDFGYVSECLPDIDFETDAAGALLATGQFIDDEWSALGVTVSTGDQTNHPAMIFDSSMPTGYDADLGTPNETFGGGPGIGSGGEAGQPGANSEALGKVLIITEDKDQNDPDDDAAGGTIIFEFAYPVNIDQVGILDIDEGQAGTVTALDGGGSVIGSVGMANSLGNNSVQTVLLGVNGVRRLEIWFPGSGAVSGIAFCVEEPVCVPKQVRDDFSRSSFGNNNGADDWSGDWIENDPQSGGAGPSAGQVQVHDGFLTLDDYPNTGGEPSAARQVDLSGALSATMRFKFLTSSGVDYDDAVTVEVSNNGGASWTTL